MKQAKTKLRRLMPSLREKKRYLVFKIISEAKIRDIFTLSNEINSAFVELFGNLGSSKAGLIFINNKFNEEKQSGIVRVNNKYVDNLKASLTMIKTINNQDIMLKSIGMSGILKKAEQYIN